MSFEKQIEQYNLLSAACDVIGSDPYVHVDVKHQFRFIGLTESDFNDMCRQIEQQVDNVHDVSIRFESTRYIGKLSGHAYNSEAAMIEGEAAYFTAGSLQGVDPHRFHIRYKQTHTETAWSSNYYSSWEEVIEFAFKSAHFIIVNPSQFTEEEHARIETVRKFREFLIAAQETV